MPEGLDQYRRWKHGLILASLVLITGLAFGRAATNGFVNLDDGPYVRGNFHVRTGLTTDNLKWAFTTGHASNYHPLTWLSLMLDSQLWGTRPAGYHVTNILLHMLNACLLYALLVSMTGAMWRAGLIAAVFAVHPLRVESVAWIAERKDVLSACFGLAALLAYVSYARRRSITGYLGVAALFTLGLLSKPMLVTLPFVMLLMDWGMKKGTEGLRDQGNEGREDKEPNRREQRRSFFPLVPQSRAPSSRPRRDPSVPFLDKLPLLALSLAACIVTFIVQRRGGAVRDLVALPLATRLGNVPISYVRYIAKTLWPTGLTVEYPYPAAWPLWQVAAATLVLLALTAAAWRRRRQNPWLLVGWLWFLGTLVPVIGLVQVGDQSLADRYTYLPGIGLLITLAWAWPAAWSGSPRMTLGSEAAAGHDEPSRPGPQRKSPAWSGGLGAISSVGFLIALAAAIIITLIAMTRNQVKYWHDGVALASHAVDAAQQASPHDGHRLSPAWILLGKAQEREGRYPEATAAFAEALRADPRSPEAMLYVANAWLRDGRLDRAMDCYRRAAALRPGFGAAISGRGVVLMGAGQVDEALRCMEQALALEPGVAIRHRNLASVLMARHETDRAMAEFAKAIALDDTDPDLYADAGRALWRAGRRAEAVGFLRRAAAMNPDSPEAREELATALAAVQPGGDAEARR